ILPRPSGLRERPLDDDPSLELRNRLGLLDRDGVADLVSLVLDMGVIVLRAAHRLLQKRMRDTALDLHDQGLSLRVADDDALENSLRHGSLPQLLFLAARFCAARVLVRARSRRTTRTRAVFCNCPLARWKRRLNCSFFNARISSDNWSSVITRRSDRRLFFFISGPYSAMRWMKRVLIGNLAAARVKAWRAISAGTPSISNMMRPGATRTTHNSGAPLPLPMRTSTGFFHTGTSGNTRIQTRPARFMWRVSARRPAPISRALTRSRPLALIPNLPKFSP